MSQISEQKILRLINLISLHVNLHEQYKALIIDPSGNNSVFFRNGGTFKYINFISKNGDLPIKEKSIDSIFLHGLTMNEIYQYLNKTDYNKFLNSEGMSFFYVMNRFKIAEKGNKIIFVLKERTRIKKFIEDLKKSQTDVYVLKVTDNNHLFLFNIYDNHACRFLYTHYWSDGNLIHKMFLNILMKFKILKLLDSDLLIVKKNLSYDMK